MFTLFFSPPDNPLSVQFCKGEIYGHTDTFYNFSDKAFGKLNYLDFSIIWTHSSGPIFQQTILFTLSWTISFLFIALSLYMSGNSHLYFFVQLDHALWSTQVWWPQLLRMIIAIPFVLPKHQDLLSLSHSPQKFHPLGKKLTMLAFLLSGGSGDFTSSYKAHHGYMAKWNKEKIQYIHKKMAKLLYSEANQSYSTTCSTCAWLSHSTISTRPYIQCRQRCQKYLSSYVTSEDGTCVGKHPPVSRLMIGVFQEKPPRPKYTEIWDVSIVLVYLQSLSPVNTLLLKELALKLVVLIFFSLRQKRSDCTFVEYWPHGFFK